MDCGININPDDLCASMGNGTIQDGQNGPKLSVVSIDKLSEEQRSKLMNIPRTPGPRRQAGTGWFTKF
jgi:hypothetical protein